MVSDRASDPRVAWEAAFGECPPLGYVLREAYPERWTRFHSLPESKRCAESRDEWAIILGRANESAARCFRESDDVWLVRAKHGRYAAADDPAKRLNWLPLFHWVDQSEDDPAFQRHFVFEASQIRWTPNAFDWLFRKIADDLASALFFSAPSGTVFAPYDGGFDVIAADPREVGLLEGDFWAWMSECASKL